MRNLKKIIALALVFALGFTFTASAADFTDKAEIGAKYVDDVNMLVELGVIAGYPGGSFGPQKNITRAEFAKMAYTIKYGSDTDGNLFAAQKSNFTDVEGNANVAWAKGYINYCANQNIVSGVGNGKFNPQGNITVAEATKMLLVILGCDPAKEGFTGANWVANVTAKAIDLGIYNGWTGDPSVLATRELVAKLMRNTIFSSVYTYSAITGAGSQMDALGQNYNQTLGEKTMGLRAVTGIVVANERYELETDENGEAFDFEAGVSLPGNIKEDESVVYYTRTLSNGSKIGDYVVLDRGLDDDMLGAKVNVYFTADIIYDRDGEFKSYDDLKVIGDVLVHSDTVAYTVNASDTKIMPDGNSSSSSEVRPYIAFTVDGVEKQVVASKDMPKVAKKFDAQTGKTVDGNTFAPAVDYDVNKDGQVQNIGGIPEIGINYEDALRAEFAKYSYAVTGADIDEDGTLDYAGSDTNINGDVAKSVMSDFGLPTLSKYRFVSVDGGATYSYIFKVVNGSSLNNISTNAMWGSVTAYSAERGTIKLAGMPAFDLDEVVLVDEVAVDDYVVFYRANGKVYVEKADAFVAKVEDFADDGAVILNGNAYYALHGGNIINPNQNLYTHFYKEQIGGMTKSADYLTFGNIILQIEFADEEIAEDLNLGVILRSWYDDEEDIGYVKIGHADNSEGTYQIGKLYMEKSSEPKNEINDRPEDFAGNAYFGMVVRYKVREDGTIDLSEQYFKDNEYRSSYADGTSVKGEYVDGIFTPKQDAKKIKEIRFAEERFTVLYEDDVDDDSYYAMNDSAIIFVLYGSPCYRENGTIDVDPGKDEVGELPLTDRNVPYSPIKSKVYNVGKIGDIKTKPIANLYVTIGDTGDIAENGVGHLVFNTRSSTEKYVVAASMSIGEKLESGDITFNKGGSFAYVVSARANYSPAAGGVYADLVLINENGLTKARTVVNVQDLHAGSVLSVERLGAVDGKNGDIPAGEFVNYSVNSDGLIDVLQTSKKERRYIRRKYDENLDSALFLVNIVGRKGDVVSFYDTEITKTVCVEEGCGSYEEVKCKDHKKEEYSVYDVKNTVAKSVKFHEKYGCEIISISGEEYNGNQLTLLPSQQKSILASEANAIIQVEKKQIVRIFSFTEGYAFADRID